MRSTAFGALPGGAQGLTTVQMSTPSSFGPTYDFGPGGVWAMPAGATRPILQWQLAQQDGRFCAAVWDGVLWHVLASAQRALDFARKAKDEIPLKEREQTCANQRGRLRRRFAGLLFDII